MLLRQLALLHISLTAYRVPRSQLLRQLALLHMLLTAYRVPRSQLLRQLALLYVSLTAYCVPRSRLFIRQLALLYLSITAYRVAGYAEVSSSGRVFCSRILVRHHMIVVMRLAVTKYMVYLPFSGERRIQSL